MTGFPHHTAFARHLASLALCFVGTAACGDAPPAPPLACRTTADCPSGFHCGAAQVCVGDVACRADAECCLGELCEDQKCRQRQMCSPAAVCAEPATACLDGLCVPRACDAAAPCPASHACVWGRCLRERPCGGTCAADEACSLLVGRCVRLKSATPPCESGRLRAFDNDAAHLAEGCAARPEVTACRELPPIPEGQRGIPGVLVRTSAGLGHVAYDRTYGDVVLATYDAAPPFALRTVRTLTGLPETAPVVGDPAGPRGGVLAPGPDRGAALDAAADAQGRISIAYRDSDADALRYLAVASDGAVTEHEIAARPGIATAVALTLLPGGAPAVLAFAPTRLGKDGNTASRLELFIAAGASPAGPGDWTTTLLESEPAAPPAVPCGGACKTPALCAVLGASLAESCIVPTAGCASTCLPSQACHAGACVDLRFSPAVFDGDPAGRGAWLDVVATGSGELVTAAYSAAGRDLVLHRVAPGGKPVRTGVDRATIPGGSTDFGRFASLAVGADGQVLVACEDSAAGRLLLVRQVGAGFAVDVIDDGHRADGLHRVGADVALARHGTGGVLLAYQDARRGDLLWAHGPKPGGAMVQATLGSQGLAGFSPTIVAVGSKAWAVASTVLTVAADGALRSEVRVQGLVWGGD